MTRDQSEQSKARAYARVEDGSKVPIDSRTIEIEFGDGGRLTVDLSRTLSERSITLLAGRAIASRGDVGPGLLAVRPGAGNVLHITLEGGQPIDRSATQAMPIAND